MKKRYKSLIVSFKKNAKMRKKAYPRPLPKRRGDKRGMGEERGGIPPRTEHRCANNQQEDNRNRSWK